MECKTFSILSAWQDIVFSPVRQNGDGLRRRVGRRGAIPSGSFPSDAKHELDNKLNDKKIKQVRRNIRDEAIATKTDKAG